MNHQFVAPVAVADAPNSSVHVIENADSAAEFLSKKWPAFRGPRHADAYAASVMAIAGRETLLVARDTFIAAAREADILVEGGQPV